MENPIDTVRRFCAAWSNNASTVELAEFFAEDAVYHNIPLDPISGRDAIAENIDTFVRPGPPGIEEIQLKIVHIATNDRIIMTERVDVFALSGRSFELAVMGTFEISNGKIRAWRDYFDSKQFASRLGTD